MNHLDESLGELRNDLQAFASSTRTESTGMRVQIAMLQVKAGVWGILGGAVPVAIAVAIKHFS